MNYSQKILPCQPPSAAQFAQARLISHRGERNNCDVLENSFAAFDPLKGSGVWGLEFDVRWTKDLEPMVFHDADFYRLYGERSRLAEFTLAEVRARHPLIPSLVDFIERYASEFHLMIELKEEHFPALDSQRRRLAEVLAPIKAGADYHLMSFNLDLLQQFNIGQPNSWIGIARTNLSAMVDAVIKHDLAGVGAHYLVLNQHSIQRLQSADKSAGCGFQNSRYGLWREVNRGVEWIFTNEALKLQGYYP